MLMKKLDEISVVRAGGTPSRSNKKYWTNGTIPWIKIGDINGKYVDDCTEFITDIGLDNSSAKLFKKGTLLYTIFATIGEVAILDFDATTNQAIAGIEVTDKSVSTEYLYYYLKHIKKDVIDTARGVAQNNINLGMLRNLIIPVPPLATQKKIVEVLDKAQGLIDSRKEQIRLMDELIQSVFYEMFGDGKYPLVKTQDVCDFITKGTTPKAGNIFHEYSEGLIPFIKVYNLSFDGTMLFDEKQQFITSEIHLSELSRSAVYPNDVLMNIVGPPLGKFSIVPSTYKEWNINQAIAIFRAKDEVIPQFLLYALMQPKVIQPFINSAVGIRQQNLNLAQCRDLKIPLPPLNLQNAFSIKVQQIQTSRTLLESSLSELENNLNGLMHNAFSGSLFHNLFVEND